MEKKDLNRVKEYLANRTDEYVRIILEKNKIELGDDVISVTANAMQASEVMNGADNFLQFLLKDMETKLLTESN